MCVTMERERQILCMCVTFPYGKSNIVFCFKKHMQPTLQFIPLFLISSEAKDVSIHIHAALKTRGDDTLRACIYHVRLDVIRPANTIWRI